MSPTFRQVLYQSLGPCLLPRRLLMEKCSHTGQGQIILLKELSLKNTMQAQITVIASKIQKGFYIIKLSKVLQSFCSVLVI